MARKGMWRMICEFRTWSGQNRFYWGRLGTAPRTLRSNRKIDIKDKRRRIKNKYKKIVVSSWSGGSFVTQKERTDHPAVTAWLSSRSKTTADRPTLSKLLKHGWPFIPEGKRNMRSRMSQCPDKRVVCHQTSRAQIKPSKQNFQKSKRRTKLTFKT